MVTAQVLIVVVGSLLSALQAVNFFVLSDLRQRIMRLETKMMKLV